MKRMIRWLSGAVVALAMMTALTVMAGEAVSAPGANAVPSDWRSVGLGAAAAFAITFSVLGAAYAVGRIGSAALGAAAEKPELLTRSIVFVALAEGLAVLGFAIAMMILQKF